MWTQHLFRRYLFPVWWILAIPTIFWSKWSQDGWLVLSSIKGLSCARGASGWIGAIWVYSRWECSSTGNRERCFCFWKDGGREGICLIGRSCWFGKQNGHALVFIFLYMFCWNLSFLEFASSSPCRWHTRVLIPYRVSDWGVAEFVCNW